MKPRLRWPLVVALVFILVRLPIELAEGPDWIANLVSVVALYLFICPVAFALHIAWNGSPRPYRTQLWTTAQYAALCRVLLMPIYWLSWVFQWKARRFQVGHGGVVGGSLRYALLFPFGQTAFWTIVALVIGGGLGSAIIFMVRRSRR